MLDAPDGHDMTLKSSIHSLLDFIRAIPVDIAVALWSGIPCTGGSPVQNANIHRPKYERRMHAHLELWNKLFDNFIVLSRAAIQRGGHLVLEWPTRCRYWRHPKVVALLGIPELEWSTARVKACAYGQRITTGRQGPHQGVALDVYHG